MFLPVFPKTDVYIMKVKAKAKCSRAYLSFCDDRKLTSDQVMPLIHPRPALPPEPRRKRERKCEPSRIQTEWTMEAEASWTAMVAEFQTYARQWSNGELRYLSSSFAFVPTSNIDLFAPSDATVEVASEEDKQRRQEHEDKMDRAWDYLLSRVLEDMIEPERAAWLRQQEEYEERAHQQEEYGMGADLSLVKDSKTLTYVDC